MTTLTPVPFYFLRHGETDWNHQGIIQGRTDIELNARGRSQAEDIARAVRTLPIASVVTSTLRRARHTAEIATAGMNLPIVALETLCECSFGIYEGQPSNGAWRDRWRAGEAIEKGESRDEYLKRAFHALNEALAYAAPVLIVAHGGSFWSLDRYALKFPDAAPGTRVANCSLFKLEPPASHSSESAWTSTLIATPAQAGVAIGESAAPAP